MKKKISKSLFLYCLFFLQNTSAEPLSSAQIKLQNLEDLSITTYLNSISHLQPKTFELLEKLQNTVNYYQRVHILTTIKTKEYTVDCIPFAEQPSLIDKPQLAQKLLQELKNKNNFKSLKEIGNYFEYNAATECPDDSIGIIRPTENALTSHVTLKKGLNTEELLQNDSTENTAGYTWQVGVTSTNKVIYIKKDHGEAYFKGPQLQKVTDTNKDDHSLDQFWLLNSTKNNERYSVEFGIMASSYFTEHPATSIFIYASVDNYGDKSCSNLSCPGFIQLPKTPVVGVPITDKSVDYVFKVTHKKTKDSKAGYYLTLEIRDSKVKKFHKVNVTLGFYPENLYPVDALPNSFGAGAEIYADAPANGTILYGNYVNPLEGYYRKKQIGMFSQNKNEFPFYTKNEAFPYGLVWKLGQKE